MTHNIPALAKDGAVHALSDLDPEMAGSEVFGGTLAGDGGT